MFDKVFTKANLHRLIAVVIGGAATSAQAVLFNPPWTVKGLALGMLGGALIGFFGWWMARSKELEAAEPAAPSSPTAAAMLAFLLFLLPLASCSPPQAQAAPVLASGPLGLSGFLAPGDSLGPYTFTVPAVPGASGYKWTATVAATNGTWTNVPSGTVTAGPTITFTLASGGVWDSVSLQLCVTGTSPVRSAKAPACTSWKVLRYLPSPTSLSGDSSKLGPISMMVRIDRGDLPTWGPSQHATKTVGQSWKQCVFWRFGSGHVLAVGDTVGCGAIAAAQFRADRLTGYSAAELDWQTGACLTWGGCLSGLGLGPRIRMAADVLLTHRA